MAGEWKEVKRRDKGSVLDRLGRDQGKHKNSRFEDVSKISISIYVTNFPYTVDSNGLGNLCGKHGTVVDVYLSKKLSKLGKRYAFVRFIKIDDVHSLIDNLRNIWIGSYKLFASSVIRDRFGNVIIDRQVPIQCNKVSSDTNFKAPIDKKLYKGSHDGPSYASVVEPKLKSTISKPANDPIELVSGDYVVS
ncbi:RNA-directed DNA polymerase, eukaryota, partial [Tanacetum coccineum]